MPTKKELGQFYTTNYKYILQDMYIPTNIDKVIEPFAGRGDLVEFIKEYTQSYTCYDIEPKQSYITQRDTLLDPPDYTNMFIVTNPPYLARNKIKDKQIFDLYEVNDLYKAFIKILIKNQCIGGILIIPLNFWCSIRKNDIELRKAFLSIYSIQRLNIFEEQVFNDTAYTVCSFQFENSSLCSNTIPISIYPSNVRFTFTLYSENYLFGGDIYHLPLSDSSPFVSRATLKNIDQKKFFTNIVVKCIDDNLDKRIGLFIVSDPETYIDRTPNHSCRTYALLSIQPPLELVEQEILVHRFNTFLSDYRIKYHSLFLTNYRESNRKRISFELVYRIVQYLLN